MYFRGPFPAHDVDPCCPCVGAVAGAWLLTTLGIVATTLTAYSVLTGAVLALLAIAIIGACPKNQAENHI